MAELIDKLITFAYLKKEVDVPPSINPDEFDHKIYRAQERLRMLMGDEFYQDFLTVYKSTRVAFSGNTIYAALYDPYIKQFIAWQAFVYWTVEANLKPTNGGYRVVSEENSVAASDEQMTVLIKDRKQQAEYYTKLLVDYMKNHYTDLPLYDNSCRSDLTGNSFHISAVKKNHDHNCKCNRCRC